MAAAPAAGRSCRAAPPGRFRVVLFLAVLSLLVGGTTLVSHLSWEQVPASYFFNRDANYSYDLGRARRPDWMAALPDAAPLTHLSIPGSHDTLTFDIADPQYRCQNNDLAAQLRGGLRYLDVRAVLVGGASLRIYHGSVYTGYTYADVLATVFAFLDEHPSEAVVMRVKEEMPPVGDPGITFGQAFNRYQHDDPETAPGWAKHFFPWPAVAAAAAAARDGRPPAFPTLGELRGKIFVLQEFASEGGPYGLVWGSAQMVLEDNFFMFNVADLERKWADIRGNLANASAAVASAPAPLFLTHLSATGAVLPSEAAAGLPANRTFPGVRGMNYRTGQWLAARPGERRGPGATGVVIADFPGADLVGEVLRRNEWLLQQ